ncbi:preprotein translocase subunit YajC [Lacihabitans sp. CCS-44]|jgi:preprotein translocase subunit YajC|uniref:preprotein translocase subunit YajC n=1 Tax=Lacihabitans sp. CCS-44 TaxID=2487331 RepID=UPI0020CD8350|nr:preprotein translocase subunit YajC [Lacihabitans sp. CCS-44]MCP9756302.1 preprotein translocase subunit YajC [Lacihabitans sp. CCS-44]
MTILQAGGNMGFLLMMVGMFVVMYFFMIRPQQKKQKDQQKMVDALKAGDDVVTAGGLHGKVMSTDETTVTISAGGGAKLTFEKSAIAKKK